MNKKVAFHVIPRYSGGSPGMVDSDTANRVAAQEVHFHDFGYLEGVYGEEKKAWAQKEGLEGIVLSSVERNGRNHFVDVITDRDYEDMPYAAIRYPDELVQVQEKKAEHFYYRRQKLASYVGRKGQHPDHFMMNVFRALQDQHGLDMYSTQVADLWKNRRVEHA